MSEEKPDRPNHLDMSWDEALSPLVETKPHEVAPGLEKRHPEPRPGRAEKPAKSPPDSP